MNTPNITRQLNLIRRIYNLGTGPLNFDHFTAICEGEKVEVICVDLKTNGFFFRLKGCPTIVLDSKLSPDTLLHVAFHELGHYFMHEPETGEAKSPKELEADMFAEMATCSARP